MLLVLVLLLVLLVLLLLLTTLAKGWDNHTPGESKWGAKEPMIPEDKMRCEMFIGTSEEEKKTPSEPPAPLLHLSPPPLPSLARSLAAVFLS